VPGRRFFTTLVALAVALPVALQASSSLAQQPVCRPVAAGEAVRVAYSAASLEPVARLLADFAIDHLLKPSPPDFERTMPQVARPFVAQQLIDNPALAGFLRGLSPLHFTQLDRTTGTVIADLRKDTREYRAPLDGVPGSPTLSLRLPERLEGGYWRGPDVLQVAFWERKRAQGRLEWTGGPAVEGELECLSLTSSGLLVRFAAAGTPALLVKFEEKPL
jgi:hypothetical protein